MKTPWINPTEFTGDLWAIDMHTHINHDSPYDTVEKIGYCTRLEDLVTISRAAGIEKMFCCTYAACLCADVVVEENEYMHGLLDQYDFLYQWVVVDPRNEETFRQAERMLKHKKCVGIKLHPKLHEYEMADYADKIGNFASRMGAIVLLHPETPSSKILPIADKFPDVTFIVAHLGSEFYVDAVEFAKHQNVYIDTSGRNSTLNSIVEYAYSRIGADHILFGTDTYAAGFQRGRIEYALIPREDKQKILRDNTMRLFAKHLE